MYRIRTSLTVGKRQSVLTIGQYAYCPYPNHQTGRMGGEEKTIFLSEKMFNSFIETKKLKTKNNDER
jgi:hypothetical protein